MFAKRIVNRRSTEALPEILDAHVEGLAIGEDRAPQLLEQHPDQAPTLKGLFGLSRRLSETLVPVIPRPQFLADLKTGLAKTQATWVAARMEHHRRTTQISNTVGTILSILALATLATRLIGGIIMLIAFLVRRRRPIAA